MVSIDEKRTRGKTRPGRLSMVDRWLDVELAAGFRPATVVDFGAGEHAWTTLELVDTLDQRLEQVRVVAIENDPRRCANLLEESEGRFEVVEAGFEIPMDDVDFLRCMNVFREYPLDQAERGYEHLREHLSPDGVLITGSCDRGGDIGSFWRIDAEGTRRLVVFTSGERGFAPKQFRDFLPRDIRRLSPNENPFFEVLPLWTEAWEATREGLEPDAAFDASISRLEQQSVARWLAAGVAEFPDI